MPRFCRYHLPDDDDTNVVHSQPDIANNSVGHQDYDNVRVMNDIKTNVPADSAEQVINEDDIYMCVG